MPLVIVRSIRSLKSFMTNKEEKIMDIKMGNKRAQEYCDAFKACAEKYNDCAECPCSRRIYNTRVTVCEILIKRNKQIVESMESVLHLS